MATSLEKIERLEVQWAKESAKPWQHWSYSRRWLKRQMNRFLRRRGKHIADDDRGYKQGRKPYKGWEY